MDNIFKRGSNNYLGLPSHQYNFLIKEFGYIQHFVYYFSRIKIVRGVRTTTLNLRFIYI